MPSLNMQIFIAAALGLILGGALSGLPAEDALRQTVLYGSGLVSSVFMGLLKMLLMPLIFSSIVVGVANLQQHRSPSKIWKVALLFFALTTALAMLEALWAAHIFKPGAGLSLSLFEDAMTQTLAQSLTLPEFFQRFFAGLFQNPIAAVANNAVLPVVSFALLLGIALVQGGARYATFLKVLQEFLALLMHLIGWVMRLAPLGILALLLKLAAEQNFELLQAVVGFVALVFWATLFHALVVLPAILYLATGRSPLWFWRGAREALITAFATSSSAATLPVSLRCAEQLQVPRAVAGFVLPLGATLNMDGTALYEAAAALFVAQLVGIELSLSQQLVVFITAMVASIGAPGIPSAGMVTMVMVLQAVGLPAEAIAILLPIDRVLDTVRTAVNVQGDLMGSVVVQHWSSQKQTTELS